MTSTRHPNQAQSKKTAVTKLLLLSLLLLTVLAGASWYQQSLAPQDGIVRHDCDLQQGSCQINLENGRLQLQAGPLPLGSLKPLNMTLSVDGISASQIQGELQGAEMYMGINQFDFEPDTASGWQAQTELAVCTSGSMRWQLKLAITTPKGIQQHLFEFEAR